MTDHDGNIYSTVQVGDQVWTKENFRCTHYNNGKKIPNVTGDREWSNLSTGALCYYNNQLPRYAEKYGALYNWYAVNTGKLAPEGWHVPSHDEWTKLVDYLIDNGYNWYDTTIYNETGKSLAAKTDWYSDTTEGNIGNDVANNNSTGFTALPGGCRNLHGGYYNMKIGSHWWSSTECNESNAFYRYLKYSRSRLEFCDFNKKFGFAIRFIKD